MEQFGVESKIVVGSECSCFAALLFSLFTPVAVTRQLSPDYTYLGKREILTDSQRKKSVSTPKTIDREKSCWQTSGGKFP